jgi:hypothetical protein
MPIVIILSAAFSFCMLNFIFLDVIKLNVIMLSVLASLSILLSPNRACSGFTQTAFRVIQNWSITLLLIIIDCWMNNHPVQRTNI